MFNPGLSTKIVEALQNAGFEAVWVGGCVRDYVIGREPHDYDIATSATPEEMIEVLKPLTKEIIPTGIKHGTITAVMEDGPMYEVTTFRIDGKYSDGRHPDDVIFTANIEDDLARRDFTFNAMALKWPEMEIIDPFSGQADCDMELTGGTLKCVGDPYKRFREDPLRILRGMRFIAQLGLDNTEVSTWDAMRKEAPLLQNISAERISTELTKIMLSDEPEISMIFPEILFEIIPEMKAMRNFNQNNPYHKYDVYHHTWAALEAFQQVWKVASNTDKMDKLTIALAILLHDIGKPSSYSEEVVDGFKRGHFYGHEIKSAEMAKEILTRLRFPTKLVRDVVEIIEAHNKTILPQEKLIRRLLNKHGVLQTRHLLIHNLCDTLGRGHGTLRYNQCLKEAKDTIYLFEEMLTRPQPFSVKDLAINGRDIMALGVEQGAFVGMLLKDCLDAVMNEECANERETLLKLVKAALAVYDDPTF